MTALSIAQRLGYISVVEELKCVTETTVVTKHDLSTEERYKVSWRGIDDAYLRLFVFIQIQAPEVSHEEHPLSDSDDEAGKEER